MFCKRCGSALPSHGFICPKCGAMMNAEQIKKQKDSIGMSLINLDIRDNIKYKEQNHIELISNNIDRYLNQGKNIYLFSFCRDEGDEEIIEKLYNIRKKDFEENLYNIKVILMNSLLNIQKWNIWFVKDSIL